MPGDGVQSSSLPFVRGRSRGGGAQSLGKGLRQSECLGEEPAGLDVRVHSRETEWAGQGCWKPTGEQELQAST